MQLLPQYPSQPLTVLDVVLQLVYVAEALFLGQSFARAMGCKETDTLDFTFRWTRLAGRTLVSLFRPTHLFLDQSRATDDVAVTSCFLPLEATPSALSQYVLEATRDLFLKFDGVNLSSDWVTQRVNEFINTTHR